MSALNIVHLYANSMSTYGDAGNVLCLAQRARWRGYEVTVHQPDIGDPLPTDADLYFFGGGQDAAQVAVGADLQGTKAERLLADTAAGVPLLAICGGYQLLGSHFLPFEAESIPGIGLFPVETHASGYRMIGNLVIKANPILDLPGDGFIVGFENHGGRTWPTGQFQPLGSVVSGFGNNGKDGSEGCIARNALGCYLHGSVLPKNPHLADWLLLRALQRHHLLEILKPLDDTLEWQTHNQLVERFRHTSQALPTIPQSRRGER